MNSKNQYILRGLLVAATFLFAGWYLGELIPFLDSGILKFTYYGAVVFITLWIAVHTLWDVDIRTPEEYDVLLTQASKPFKFPKTTLFLVLLLIGISEGIKGYERSKDIYNANVEFTNDYSRETLALATLYDNMWKTYSQTLNIVNLSKESFVQLVDIAFSARKDGQALAWKWTIENQPLPYEQFSKMYTDLSEFVKAKREQIAELEYGRQDIATEQNKMLSRFPNNVYNSLFLGLDKIEYKYGILSDSTNTVIASGIENLK